MVNRFMSERPNKKAVRTRFLEEMLTISRFLCTFATENKNINHHETTYFIIDSLHTRPA